MKKRLSFWCIISIFIVTAAFLTLQISVDVSHAKAKPIKLKWQVAVPTGSTLWGGFSYIAERAKELSGGRLELELLPAGSVIPAFEQLTACSGGVIDASGGWAVYWGGKHPAAGLFYGASGGPYGMDHFDFLGWLYQGGGKELYQRFYDDVIRQNVHVIPTSLGSTIQPLGWFNRPIRSIEDMKKVKWRVGGFAAETWKVLGSSTVMIPAGEVFPAGERGVIDGAEWVAPAEDYKMSFYDVWKNYVMPGVSEVSCMGELLINKDVWNRLAPDLQAILEAACIEGDLRHLNWLSYENAEALRKMKNDHGVKLIRTPIELLNKYLDAWDNVVVPKYSKKYPFFKEVLDSQKSYASRVVPGRAFVEADRMWLAKRYWPKGGVVGFDFEKDVWEGSRK